MISAKTAMPSKLLIFCAAFVATVVTFIGCELGNPDRSVLYGNTADADAPDAPDAQSDAAPIATLDGAPDTTDGSTDPTDISDAATDDGGSTPDGATGDGG